MFASRTRRVGSWIVRAWVLLCVLSSNAYALDGLVLATSNPYFNLGDVLLFDASTGTSRTLVQGNAFGPTFSPDGGSIAYWRDGKIWTLAIDGGAPQELCASFANEFKRQTMSWALDGHIYWSEETPEIYRVNVANGEREVVWTGTRQVQLAKVSLDGTRAAASSPAWNVLALNLVSGEQRDFGGGCQGTVSADGRWVTHNIDHHVATIHDFETGAEIYSVTSPTPDSDVTAHRFSHLSDRHIVYTDHGRDVYVVEVDTDTRHYIGTGQAWDFHPATGMRMHVALQPRVSNVEVYHQALAPHISPVSIVSTPTPALPAQMQLGASSAAWLEVDIVDNDGAAQLQARVDNNSLAPGDYTASVVLAVEGAANPPLQYEVNVHVVDVTAPLRINFGRPEDDAAAWVNGSLFVSGTPLWIETSAVDINGIEHAAPASIYHSGLGPGSIGLTLPVVDDNYTLRVHMRAQSAAHRIDLSVQDNVELLQNVDVLSQSGSPQKPWLADFDVEVSNGLGLSIIASATVGPLPVAIELLQRDAINTAPNVDAGANIETISGVLTAINGSVSDDGYPDGQLNSTWSQLTGPGNAVFSDASSASTYVLFDVVGEYTLQLHVSDGELESTDTLVAIVQPPPQPSISLLHPNGGEVWQAGTTQYIEWSSQDLRDVSIRFSQDAGQNWQTLSVSVDDGLPEWGRFPWLVPALSSSECLVAVEGYFGEALAVSAAPFRIEQEDLDSSIKTDSCGCRTQANPSDPLLLLSGAVLLLGWRRRKHNRSKPGWARPLAR